jgi:hypothetical protein
MPGFVAAQTGDCSAAERLRDALRPYRGRLVVLGGAVGCLGPVSIFLGLLAAQLGLLDEATECLEEAIAFTESVGALPGQVLCLEAAARTLTLRRARGDREKASAHSTRSPSSAATGTGPGRAGGSYLSGSGHVQAFVASEVKGRWRAAIEVPGSGTLNAGGNAQVESVSCASAGNCGPAGCTRTAPAAARRSWPAR